MAIFGVGFCSFTRWKSLVRAQQRPSNENAITITSYGVLHFLALAWFKKGHFEVTGRTLSAASREVGRFDGFQNRSVAGKASVAEQFQPMGMALARQQLGGTFVDPLGMLAA